MPELAAPDALAPDSTTEPAAAVSTALSLPVQLGLSLLFVALATVLAFVAWHVIAAPNLTLIYVLPVIAAAALFGWIPAVLAVVLGVACYDFFFTAPYYSLAIDDPAEIWAAALLLVIATIVASVSATSRRRALEAREAAERAEALQTLAHVVVTAPTPEAVLQTAAAALHRLFRAPAVVLMQGEGGLRTTATAGGAQIRQADEEAARGALSTGFRTRGETYPYDRTYFDFWPISTPTGHACVLGVDFTHSAREHPAAPEKLIEAVSGYVAAGLARGPSAPAG